MSLALAVQRGTRAARAPRSFNARGYVTPRDFGAIGADTPAQARTVTGDTLAVQQFMRSHAPNKKLDRWYRIEDDIVHKSEGNEGFALTGMGGPSDVGFVLQNNAGIEVNDIDYSNPSGLKIGSVLLRDLSIIVDSAATNDVLRLIANDGQSGASRPGAHIENVHFPRADSAFGTSGNLMRLRNLRNLKLSNVEGSGRYFGYQGTAIKIETGEGSSPVEIFGFKTVFDHFQRVVYAPAAEGSTPNDEWQGMHFAYLTGIAIDRLVDMNGGPEEFAEWISFFKPHAGGFREHGIVGENCRRVNISHGYFFAEGSNSPYSVKKAIDLHSTTSASQYHNITDNDISFEAATGVTERFGIEVTEDAGVTRGWRDGNEVVSATTAYSTPASMAVGNDRSY